MLFLGNTLKHNSGGEIQFPQLHEYNNIYINIALRTAYRKQNYQTPHYRGLYHEKGEN